MQWQVLLICATWTTQVYLTDAQVDCHPLCLSCSGPGVNQCLECRHFSYNNTCVQRCPLLTYIVPGDTLNGKLPYSTALPTVSNTSYHPSNINITSNDPLENTTLPTDGAPVDRTTSIRGTCEDCHPECQDGCYGNSPRDCYRCKHVTFNGTCLSCCPEGSYPDPRDPSSCRSCHEECERGCRGPGPEHCHRCKHVQFGGRCVRTCPNNSFQAPDNPSVCRPCHNKCEDNCVGPWPEHCEPSSQAASGARFPGLPVVLALGAVAIILLVGGVMALVRIRRRRSRKPPSSPTRDLACYEARSISTIAIPLNPEESPMSELYRNVCAANATYTADSDDDVRVSPAPSVLSVAGYPNDNGSSLSGCSDTISEGGISNESKSTDSTVVRVPIPSSEQHTRVIQTDFDQMAMSTWPPHQSSSHQALDKMAPGWRFSYLTDDSGIVSDGSRCSTMDNQSRWSVATSGTGGSGDSRLCLHGADVPDGTLSKTLAQESCEFEKDTRRTCESLQGAPSDKPSTGGELGSLDSQAAERENVALSCLLSKFRDVVGDPKTVEPTAVNFSTPRFVAGMFDKRGGRLTLEHLGIDLFIPPDAVVDEATEIFLYARSVDETTNNATEKKWKPPVIQCGPHGLKFNRHVILTVKHPAEDLTKWSFKFRASNTDIGENPDWKDLTEDQSALCFAHGDKTVIFVDHFTLYSVSGELVGAEGEDWGEKVDWRRFRMGVFAEPLFLDTEIFQLRVRCWQDNDDEQQRSREKERYLGAVQLGDDKVLHLAGDGGNLSVVLERLRPGWLAFNGDRQTIPFTSLWNEHAEMPSCTFDIERQPSGLVPKTVVCRVTAAQVQYPDNYVSIDVLKQLGHRQDTPSYETPGRPSVPSLGSESTFLRLQPELRPTPRCAPQFPDGEQFGLLCLVLDVEDPVGRDWRRVAEALHLPCEFIQWMKQRGDPTRRLMDFLVAQHGDDSLRVLRDALMTIGHQRALQMVESMMETSDPGPLAGGQYNVEQQWSSDGQPFAGMWNNDDGLHSSDHRTTPKEVHNSNDCSQQTVRSHVSCTDYSGNEPSQRLQTLSVDPTSHGSTTVEKVSGERSLGDGQEAEVSMTSVSITPQVNTLQVPPTEVSSNSITVPKTLRSQDSGYHSDDRSPGETNSAFTMEDETGDGQAGDPAVVSGSTPDSVGSTTETDTTKEAKNKDAERGTATTEKSTSPWPLLMNLKNKMSLRSKSLPDLLWGQNKADAAKQANKNISTERLSQTM